MKQDEIRRKLIDGTIHVIATDGLDKATTKQIGIETSINEAYIYRCFKDKEDLFAKTFESLDDELVNKAMENITVMYMPDFEYHLRCRVFFNSIWHFLLGNRDKCVTYIRYYYSPYFFKNSAEKHNEKYIHLIEKLSEAFRAESNVWMIMNHILNTMFDFSIKVYNGVIPDNEDTEEHVFRLVYYSVKQYFRNKETAVG